MGGHFSLFSPQLSPKESADEPDSYQPSDRMIRFALTPCVKNFREFPIATKVQLGPDNEKKKILVYCTSKRLVRCTNGTYFNSGHHPAETFLPLYHWDRAGFEFEFVTMDGAKVAVEEWAFKACAGFEKELQAIRAKYEDLLNEPKKSSEIDPSTLQECYLALFMPGGHGPIIETHTDKDFGAILHAANKIQLPTITLCHGPSTLRSAALIDGFPYNGYEICVFPDKQDNVTPRFGYLPGWLYEEDKAEAALKKLGFKIKNKDMNDTTHVDRELVTGASQLAAQNLAEVGLKVLWDKYNQTGQTISFGK